MSKENRPLGCKCQTLSVKLCGDGCDECNHELSKELEKMESKEQTPITAEEYLKQINWWDSGAEPDGKFWADQWQLAEAMERYAQAKVLEVLKEEVENAWVDGWGGYYTSPEKYYETEVKPKYE